jgi:hypothetical protein
LKNSSRNTVYKNITRFTSRYGFLIHDCGNTLHQFVEEYPSGGRELCDVVREADAMGGSLGIKIAKEFVSKHNL